MRISDSEKGIFPIGVVADIIGVSPKRLRIYETKGIITPARSDGNRRLYSEHHVELLTYVHYLASVRKVNLAGIKAILEVLELLDKKSRGKLMREVEKEIESLSDREKQAFEHVETEGGNGTAPDSIG